MRLQPSATRVAKKWKKLPPGWTDESVTKFWKTLGKGTPEHKVWNCIYKMTGVFNEPGGFCGGLADWKDPGWRKEITKQDPDARAQARKYWKAKIKGKGGKKASAARVALRFAARSAPPMQMGSAKMVAQQGYTPVDVWFGEAQPHRRSMLELGDMVQDRRGDLYFFAGIASDGSVLLGKDEREAQRLHKQVIEDRKHFQTRGAAPTLVQPLMLQPDYGHGDAAVPGDEEYHPCQHGLPCECGGGCGCGGK